MIPQRIIRRLGAGVLALAVLAAQARAQTAPDSVEVARLAGLSLSTQAHVQKVLAPSRPTTGWGLLYRPSARNWWS